MSDWFLKKSSGEIFGPAPLADLKTWAAEGRIEPGDMVSVDGDSWQSATSLAELELHYLIILGGSSQFGPIHLRGLKDLVQESELDPTCPVLHVPSGMEQPASKWLDDEGSVAAQENTLTANLASPAAVEDPITREEEPASGELNEDWKQRYEAEVKARLAAEHELHEQLDDLRDQLRVAQTHPADDEANLLVYVEASPLFRQLKNELDIQRSEYQRLESQHEGLVKQHKESVEALAEVQARMVPSQQVAQVTEVEHQRDEAIKRADQLTTEVQTLKQQLAELANSQSETEDRSRRLDSQEQLLKRQVEELETARQRESERAQALADEVESLNAQLKERKDAQPQASKPLIDGDTEIKHHERWEQMYHRERADHQESDRAHKQANQELRDQLAQALKERNRAHQKVQKLEKRLEEAKTDLSPADGAQKIASLQDAYEQLKENHDSLLEQIQAKNAELELLRSQSTKKTDVSGQRLTEIQNELEVEKNRAQEALRQLADMEERHMELLRSYRDLNDRYVRLKHADYNQG